jgi:hypothetical protein
LDTLSQAPQALEAQAQADPREKEARDLRYFQAAVVVVLRDGSFAVFANDRSSESMFIADNPDDLALAIASRFKMNDRKRISREELKAQLVRLEASMKRNGAAGTGSASSKSKADFSDLFNE